MSGSGLTSMLTILERDTGEESGRKLLSLLKTTDLDRQAFFRAPGGDFFKK